MVALDYLRKVGRTVPVAGEIYEGKEGALRLAREVGFCLKDNPREEALEAVRDSYNYVCIIGYILEPPIDKKEWDAEVMRGLNR